MADIVVSIHRKRDLRHARALAEFVRRQKKLPALVIPNWIVERLADQLQAFREERHAALAKFKAELEAECAVMRVEINLAKDQIEAVRTATEAFVAAREKLNEALLPLPRSGLAAQQIQGAAPAS